MMVLDEKYDVTIEVITVHLDVLPDISLITKEEKVNSPGVVDSWTKGLVIHLLLRSFRGFHT